MGNMPYLLTYLLTYYTYYMGNMPYLLTYLLTILTIWEICQQANKPASIRHVGTARKPWGKLQSCNLG